MENLKSPIQFSSNCGEIILRTDLNYVVRDLARYGEINKLTHDEHQKANDAQVDGIIGGVKKGTILVKKGKKTKADYEREQAKEGVYKNYTERIYLLKFKT